MTGDTKTPGREQMTWYQGEMAPRREVERITRAEAAAPVTAPPPGPAPTPATEAPGPVGTTDCEHAPAPENYAAIPAAMRATPRWVTWQYEIRDAKRTKVPHTPGKGRAKSTDPATWVTFEGAVRAAEFYHGIGFVLGDGWIGIDWDHVRDPRTGAWTPGILEEIHSLETYAELSPSGTGAHAIVLGDAFPGTRSRAGDGPEFYASGRYFTVTGNHIEDTPEEVRTPPPGALEALYHRHIPMNEEIGRAPTAARVPRPTADPDLTDGEIVEKCQNAANAATFNALWRGDTSGYPSGSEADLALCCILTFYTRDPAQLERLVRQSGLYREKWDRVDYVTRTIGTALQVCRETWSPGKRREVRRGTSAAPGPETGDDETGAADYHLTDAGNSERLVRFFGDVIRYCAPLRQWLVWDGRRWEQDETNRMLDLATQTAKMIFREAAEAADSEAFAKWALRSESLTVRRAMIDGAVYMVPVRAEDLDARPHLFNCLNGTLDLSTGEFREHRKEDLLTKMSGVRYDPDAKCPLWLDHLHTVFAGDEEVVEAFQMVAGYSLLQYNPEQVAFILWGHGKNGKSETVKGIARVMGDYATNIEASTLMETRHNDGGRARPDILRLRGARFVTVTEPGENDVLSEPLIKSVTGDHAVTARPLYGKPIEFKPGAKIFIGTNYKPKIRGRDEGIWRRIWLFPFVVIIPPEKRQRDYGDYLFEQEGSGIFNWILSGLRRYLEQGKLEQPAAVQKATQDYRIEMNPVGRFVAEGCVIDRRERVGKGDLYTGYKEWCEATGWKPMGKIKFGEFIATLFDEERDRTGHRYWVGIRRKTVAEIENEDAPVERQAGLDDLVTEGDDIDDKFAQTFHVSPSGGKVREILSSMSSSEDSVPSPVITTIATYTWHNGLAKNGGRCSVKGCNRVPEWVNKNGEWPLCSVHYNEIALQSKRGGESCQTATTATPAPATPVAAAGCGGPANAPPTR